MKLLKFDTTILCLVLALAALVATFVVYDKDTGMPEPVEMTVLQNDTLEFFGLEKLKTKRIARDNFRSLPKRAMVRKGETVKVISAIKPDGSHAARFWIETSDGTRGLLNQTSLERRGFMIKETPIAEELNLGDSIEILDYKSDIFGGKSRVRELSTGKEFKNVPATHFVTHTIAGMDEHMLNLDAFTITTLRQFRNQYFEQDLEHCLAQGVEPFSVIEYADTIRVVLPYKVFSRGDGSFFRPTLKFAHDGKYLDWEWYEFSNHYNSWLLKWLPGAEWVFAQPWMTAVLNETMFKSEKLSKRTLLNAHGILGTILALLIMIPIGLLFCVWLGSWGLVVPLLLIGLIRFRWLYLPFNNFSLRIFIVILSLAWAYICAILMLGYTWWYVYLPIAAYLLYRVYDDLLDPVIFSRCSKCGRLDSIKLISQELVKEEEMWVDESRFDKQLNSWKEEYETYDKEIVTTRTMQGNVEVNRRTDEYKRNVKKHVVDHGTKQYNDFMVKYLYKLFRLTLECEACKDLTYDWHTTATKLEEKKVGQHTVTY